MFTALWNGENVKPVHFGALNVSGVIINIEILVYIAYFYYIFRVYNSKIEHSYA